MLATPTSPGSPRRHRRLQAPVALLALLIAAACASPAATQGDVKDADAGTADDSAAGDAALADSDGGDSSTDVSSTAEIFASGKGPACDASTPCPTSTLLCRRNDCAWDGKCITNFAPTGMACNDDNPCTANDVCIDANGTCKGTLALTCVDDDNPCTTEGCDPLSGKCNVLAPDGTFCDDGLPCTASSNCKDGTCTVGFFNCKCIPVDYLYEDVAAGKKKDTPWWQVADIAAKVCPKLVSTSNPCLGEQFCDVTDSTNWHCAVVPNTGSKACKPSANACEINTCVNDPKAPNAGACATGPAKANTLCDDGEPCTVNDVCDGAGLCLAGTSLCACTPATAAADCGYLLKGPCDGDVFCDTSGAAPKCAVVPGSAVVCAEGTQCSPLKCDTKSGACTPVAKKDGVLCEDGNACTDSETCYGGVCAAPDLGQKAKNQSDSDPSNDNAPTGGEGTYICKCEKDADCADDGDLCNGVPYCDAQAKSCLTKPFSDIKCPTSNDTDCVRTLCDGPTGKCVTGLASNIQTSVQVLPGGTVVTEKFVPFKVKDVVLCDDGDSCSKNDSCVGSMCVAGNVLVCGCAKDADCPASPDGLCGPKYHCDVASKSCKALPGSKVSCDASNDSDCAHAVCDPQSGACVSKPHKDGAVCDDGDSCSYGDVCKAGVCASGGNACTCSKDADCALGGEDKCAATLKCDLALAKPHCVVATAAVACPPTGGACTVASCDKGSGKCVVEPALDGSWCSDGKACTSSSCQDGACASKPIEPCVPSLGCKKDSDCASDKCAKYTCTISDGTGTCSKVAGSDVVCPDGKPCVKQTCSPMTGKCAKPIVDPGCDDSNECTADSCGAKGDACTYAPWPDGSFGGVGKVCLGGKPVATQPGLRLVPGGKAFVGCNKALESCAETTELPQHEVTLSPYFIDAFEVSVQRYKACVQAGACTAAAAGAGCTSGASASAAASLPINCVTHAQASKFCAFSVPGGRLPTEAEWEVAARGGCDSVGGDCATAARTWPWGSKPAATCFMATIADPGASCHPKEVGVLGANASTDRSAYDVFDVAGNLREWTGDGYDAAFYGKAAASGADPKSPAAATVVVRGGSFALPAAAARLARRDKADATTSAVDIGFRCVVSVK